MPAEMPKFAAMVNWWKFLDLFVVLQSRWD
jgi:hypothetical protein